MMASSCAHSNEYHELFHPNPLQHPLSLPVSKLCSCRRCACGFPLCRLHWFTSVWAMVQESVMALGCKSDSQHALPPFALAARLKL